MPRPIYLRGLAERELQDFDRALDDFDRMIQIDGENVLGRYQRGLVLYDMRHYDRAIHEFDRAINAKPDYAPRSMSEAWPTARPAKPGVRSRISTRRSGSTAISPSLRQSGQYPPGRAPYDLALADYSAAVALNPKDAYSLYSRGLVMRALGQDEAAEREIAKAKAIEPGIGP